MLFTEWNMDEALAVSKEEGFEDGREEGIKEGIKEGEKLGEQRKQQELIRAFSDVLEPEVIAEKVKRPVAYVLKVLEETKVVSEEEAASKTEK